jgi:pimeloyl-ACP methyl ester carboxylesterase
MPQAPINGIEICYDTFGDPQQPCLLLISGLGSQLTNWHEHLCEQFANLGLYVVRFDNRDSGLSTHFNEFTSPDVKAAARTGDVSSAGYSLRDMAVDAVALLEYLNVPSAHVFGVSMGGMIAQIMAIEFPERVASLVLMSTTTGNLSVGQPAPEIQADPSLRNFDGDPLSRQVASSGRWASWSLGITQATLMERIKRRYERSHDPLTSARQWVAVRAAPDRTEELRDIKVPVTVIHGTDDPLVDVSGGKALAEAIPNAELILIEHLRHDLPPVIWPELVGAVQRNLENA